jgi:hypothetical protein
MGSIKQIRILLATAIVLCLAQAASSQSASMHIQAKKMSETPGSSQSPQPDVITPGIEQAAESRAFKKAPVAKRGHARTTSQQTSIPNPAKRKPVQTSPGGLPDKD